MRRLNGGYSSESHLSLVPSDELVGQPINSFIMPSLKKRYVVVAGILGGFAIAFQDTTTAIWNRVQNQFASISIPSPQLSQDPARHAWISEMPLASSSQTLPSTSSDYSVLANSSLGQHMRAGEVRVDSAREPNSTQLISSGIPPARPTNPAKLPTIRIASFSLEAFGESKLKKKAVVETIASLLRQFDVIALQHIQSRQQNILPELVDKVNQSDRRYDYCIGPRVGSESNPQQFAFLFDTDRLETDRQQLYTIDDPQSLMEFDPLVGWFRCKGVPSDKAFTFTLVNIRLDALSHGRELKLLPDLLRSVRQDGRSEDDVLLLGNFGYSDREMDSLRNVGMLFALEGTPTTVTGESMLDNIIFPTRATDEFTGRAGVVDFLRQWNLSIDQAFQVSTHMPIWAEFFAAEGGSPGYVAK